MKASGLRRLLRAVAARLPCGFWQSAAWNAVCCFALQIFMCVVLVVEALTYSLTHSISAFGVPKLHGEAQQALAKWT